MFAVKPDESEHIRLAQVERNEGWLPVPRATSHFLYL